MDKKTLAKLELKIGGVEKKMNIFTKAFEGAKRVAAVGGFQVASSIVNGTFIDVLN